MRSVRYDEKQGLNGRRELGSAVVETIAGPLEDIVERPQLPGRLEESSHRVSDVPPRVRLGVPTARHVKLRYVRDEGAIFLQNPDGESRSIAGTPVTASSRGLQV